MPHDGRSSLTNNASRHPLVYTGEFSTLEQYFGYLIHLKGYEEAASLVADCSVLDLGCNNGYGTRYLMDACREIVGLDVSESAISDGRRMYDADGLRLERYDGIRIPFADQTFDRVVSLQVIEHIDMDLFTNFMAETCRVLRPDGLAVFTTPNAGVRLLPGAGPWNEFHAREYTRDQLDDSLRGWFGSVEIRGLIGTGPVYRRVLASYRSAQKHSGARPPLTSLIAQRVPGARWAWARLKSVGAPQRRPEFSEYSTGELEYAPGAPADPLDFLAICRLPLRPA